MKASFPYAQHLVDQYGLETVEWQTLPGEIDDNFQVLLQSGKTVVVKVASSTRTSAELDFQVDLLRHLATNHLPVEVPQVLPALSGRLITVAHDQPLRHCLVLTWVDGAPLRKLLHRPTAMLQKWGAVAGHLNAALANFDHLAAHRHSDWDPRWALARQQDLHLLSSNHQRALAQQLFARIAAARLTSRDDLPQSVCYADAHEDNLLIRYDAGEWPQLTGLIDVSDAVYTYTVSELAIACAYACMDQPDPLGAMVAMTQGYTRHATLLEAEVAALLPLTLSRLLITVFLSARAAIEAPAHAYRQVSEQQAWAVLERLALIPPQLAEARLRVAAGLAPYPQHDFFQRWLDTQPTLAPLLQLSGRKLLPLDFSVGSTQLGNYSNYLHLPRFTRLVTRTLEDAHASLGYGGYLETRPFYTSDLFEQTGNDGPRWRTVHLGLDVWGPPGEAVHAPLQGTIHSFRQNSSHLDYGATVILQHEVSVSAIESAAAPVSLTFFTLYGHLSADSLQELRVGQPVQQGEAFAKTGTPQDNGGWPPHLHFQVILDMLGYTGDFPGVAFPEEATTWASLCPDPATLAGLPLPTPLDQATDTQAQLIARRQQSLGRSLSLSYAQPLHIVRGQGCHLLDITGRRYLDTVNNVAHVGHEHQHIVEVLQSQAAVLNTNTRYLHEQLPALAEAICATLPPALQVAFIVNSGSEANELALRLARVATGEQDIIALQAGYHGNTSATIDVSSYKFDGRGGAGAPATTHVLDLPDLYRGEHQDAATVGAAYAAQIDEVIQKLQARERRPAAFISESILSCGGQVVLPKGYLAAAYAKTRAAGGVCIADEVQTGLGRVGQHFWAFELQEVVPDIVTIGKPLGNGHPVAAVVCTRAVADAFAATGMEYFNTFGGNPVSCAVARAVLQVVQEEHLQANAAAQGAYLVSELHSLQKFCPRIGDIRGHGLFLGIDLVDDRASRNPATALANRVINQARDRGLLLSSDGPGLNVLKIKPPLTFSRRQADFLLEELARLLA